MNSIKFDIQHDGDFGYEVLFTTFVHNDRDILIKKMIENLREINETFTTTREYVKPINECISRFLSAYSDISINHYQDKKQLDVWFVRNENEFSFSFNIENGNHSFNIFETDEITVIEVDGGYLIIEK